MLFIRLYVVSLPQALLLLLLGAQMDLLGGWNHSETALHVLLLLSLIAPLFTMGLLILELVRYRRRYRESSEGASFRWPAVALLLCVETFAINLYILSQMKM